VTARNASVNENNITLPITHMEPTIRGEQMAKKENQGHDKRVNIHIESRRHRLTDTDAISAKAAIDGLVISGLLQGDRAQDVAEVSYSQSKVAVLEPEITIITISRRN